MITFKNVLATNAIIQVQLGFVPDKLLIRNRVSLYSVEWNRNLAEGEFYLITNAGVRTLVTTSTPISIVDGSDKTNNINMSFGIVLGTYANINDTVDEPLDVEATREDGV